MSNAELDPKNSGALISKALIFEAIANLGVLPAITHPRWVLSKLVTSPALINPASTLFLRMTGGLVVGCLVVPLLQARGDTPSAVQSRRTAYTLLAGGEIAFIGALLADLRSAAPALSPFASRLSIGCLLPPLLWRGYALFVNPDIMGRVKEKSI